MALGDDVRLLASLQAFGDLDPEAIRLVAFSAETRILRVGDVLFRRGDASDGGFVVLTGAIALQGASGEETLVRAPVLLGEVALVAETLRPATAVAREPASVLKVSRALYLRLLADYPEAAERLRAGVARRLFALRDELEGVRQELTRT